MAVTKNLSKEQIEDSKVAFFALDRDGDGKLNEREIMNLLKTVGQNPTEAEAQELIKAYDTTKSGALVYDDFLRYFDAIVVPTVSEDELLHAFQTFDREGVGKMAVGEFRTIMNSMGLPLKKDETEALIEGTVVNEFVEYKPFIKKLMRKK